MQKLVSILVPFHNVSNFIIQAVESILHQSYKNIEAILVDDASTDGSCDLVIKRYKDDARLKLIRSPVKGDIVTALNMGLAHCNGEYIARCDADDVMDENRITRQVQFIESNGSDIVGVSHALIDESNNFLRRVAYPTNPKLLKKLLDYKTPMPHTWLARRVVYESLKEYRLPGAEDYDFLSRASDFGFKMSVIPNYYGMLVRIRRGNTATTLGFSQQVNFHAAKKLHDERVAFGSEVTSIQILQARRYGKTLMRLHGLSEKICFCAASSQNFFVSNFLRVLASIISPFRFNYYLRVMLSRFLVWSNRE